VGRGCRRSSRARQAIIRQALGQLERQRQRLLDAYLAEVVALAELGRKRQELDRRRATLLTQQRQLNAVAEQRLELDAVADGIEAFCQTVRAGLATATFAQRRLLVELLIDRVVVTDGEVEIRYVLPTAPDGPHPPFCQLRKDHLHPPTTASHLDEGGQGGGGRGETGVEGQVRGVADGAAGQQPEPHVARPAPPPQRHPHPVVQPPALAALPALSRNHCSGSTWASSCSAGTWPGPRSVMVSSGSVRLTASTCGMPCCSSQTRRRRSPP
jgi:hypothetical protein